MLLVLYMAYAAQVIGAAFLGGVLSAFVGALVVVPVTALVAQQPRGPAALVSFMPAFWLLVPGALGLVGVTDLLYGDTERPELDRRDPLDHGGDLARGARRVGRVEPHGAPGALTSGQAARATSATVGASSAVPSAR